jgi:hypothetical protein
LTSDFKASLVSKLKFKSKEVSLELSEAEAIYKIAVSDFVSAVNDYCLKKNIDNPLSRIVSKKNENKQISSEFKSLFRQIASATHPDKCADSNRDIFEKAVEAKNNNKTVNLLNLASDLKIKVNDISFSSIKEIEYDIKKTEEEIKKIHHSYPWIWYYAPFSERQKILDSFILDQV